MKLRSDNLARKFHNRTTPAISATGVAQIFNLLYRRIAFGRPLQMREAGGLQIRDTAECNSALRSLQPASVCEISGMARGPGASKRSEDGMATFILIALLAIMVVLVMAESRALFHLHREVKLLEQKQIKRLDASQTNSIGRAELPLGQDAQQRVPAKSGDSR
jgi:hypothetical protein